MHLFATLAVVVHSRGLPEAMGELVVGELSLFNRGSNLGMGFLFCLTCVCLSSISVFND